MGITRAKNFRLALLVSLCWLAPLVGAHAADGSTTGSEQQLRDIPNACGYLTEELALTLLAAERVRPGPANQHIPKFWSKCSYIGNGKHRPKLTFNFKFMLWEMFDVANLAPLELEFNVKFASGALPLVDSLKQPGQATYVFKNKDSTVLMMITGIHGPDIGAGQASGLIATYQLDDSSITHAQRLEELLAQARDHYREWHAQN